MGSELLRSLGDLISPRLCIHCGQFLSKDTLFLCSECLQNEPYLTEEDLAATSSDHFPDGSVKKIFSPADFTHDSSLRNAVLTLKYKDGFRIGKYLGQLIAQKLRDSIIQAKIDLIVPVPLHRSRLIERGYNQAELIAYGLSSETGIDISTKVIKRVHFAHRQVASGSRDERFKNMQGAFKVVDTALAAERKILLVDDVITIGATIRAAANSLRAEGAAEVYAASVLVVCSHSFRGAYTQ